MSKHCPKGEEAAAVAIRKQSDIISAMAPAVRSLDMEAIHDMRVASRRLRRALMIYRPFLPKANAKALRKQARRITDLLGTRRELDVMATMLREHRAETRDLWRRFMDHAILIIDQRREGQSESCQEAADIAEGDDFHAQTASILEALDGTGLCARKRAKKELTEAFEAARLARKNWRKTKDPEALHHVRIALKRLRYVGEFNQALYGEPLEVLTGRVKELQALLGEWNECRLLEDMLLTIGNAADYSVAQGAPLVAEAYGNRAADLAIQFGPMGKDLLEGIGRKDFKKLVGNTVVKCCPK